MQPRYPIYIPSKGRAESRLTVKALDRMGIDYHVIVEASERNTYAQVIDPAKLLVLDPAYQRDYDACMELEPHQSRGSGPARNFAWDHAVASGAAWHWVIDDNIRSFMRLKGNRKWYVRNAEDFRYMEDFAQRYANVAMVGPAYQWNAKHRQPLRPFIINTRLYSCMCILTGLPYRWRGRYNEDTILSLDMLKDGWCTVEFNAFLQDKQVTQSMKGGNTDELYRDGTLAKSQMLVREHPDVCRLTWKFGRWHHECDYRPFKYNQLKRKPDAVIPDGPNEYGMKFVQLGAD